MKHLQIIIAMLLLSIAAFGQTNIPLAGYSTNNTSGATDLGGNTYQIQMTVTEGTGFFNGTDILEDSTFVYWKDCERFIITDIDCGSCFLLSGTINVILSDVDNNGIPSTGLGAIVNETSSDLGGFISSISSTNQQCLSAYYTDKIQLAINNSNGATNLAYTASPTDGVVTSDTGTDATIPVADGTNSGLMSPSDFDKLNSLTSGSILVGNASNIATEVVMSNDATIDNTGAITFATVNSNPGNFGSGTVIPVFTINGKGLITTITNTTIPNFNGASGASGGTKGFVPAPSGGEEFYFLRGNGTWALPNTATVTASALNNRLGLEVLSSGSDYTVGLNIVGLSAITGIADDDVLVVYDDDGAVNSKVSAMEFLPKNRGHASETAVSPATAGSPTLSEIQTWTTTNSFKDMIVYYTGDDLPASTPTYVYDIDRSGVATLVEKPAATPIVNYSNGQAEIWATGTGITFSVTPGTQEWVFSIPSGVEIKRAVINFSLADAGGGGTNTAYVKFDYAGARGFNTTKDDLLIPVGHITNADNSGSVGRGAAKMETRGWGANSQDVSIGVSLFAGGDGSDLELEFTTPAIGLENVMTIIFD